MVLGYIVVVVVVEWFLVWEYIVLVVEDWLFEELDKMMKVV